MKEHNFDVLIVGAGVSGIGVACHLKMKSPEKSYAILERRKAIGGTWDLFRYPGIRSDSDMYTFGYAFRPWQENKVLASGPAIKQYVSETADEYGVTPNIRFGRKVVSADWSSQHNDWTLEALIEETGEKEIYRAPFIINASGYYNYDHGYRPDFAGEKTFKGQVVHPQHWPEDLDYTGKKVVIIGSGATAITLVPAMADKTEHITMLQRSPTYIATVPSEDVMSAGLSRFLPRSVVYHIGRARNIAMQRFFWLLSKTQPEVAKRILRRMVQRQVGEEVDMKHFTPTYNPWDQRVCVVPDGDLFKVIRRGKASVVTDQIDTFTEKGIKLKSGQELEADIIVTATGLDVQLMGGVQAKLDGKPVNVAEGMLYKGVLFENVPNAAIIIGYTNASWTLKVDIASEYINRLFKHMDKKGYNRVVPRDHENSKSPDSVMGGLNSGYLVRAGKVLPRNGTRGPWKVSMDYISDTAVLRYGSIEDECLEFSRVPVSKRQPAAKAPVA